MNEPVRKAAPGGRWHGVEVMPYKEDGGTHFRAISRQTLFAGDEGMPVEMRTFRIEDGGHSTLERHAHVHLVMVLEGSGHVLVQDRVHALSERDIVHIPAWTWHQFRADAGQPLVFLCLVACERDRPTRPTEDDLVALRRSPEVAEFIRV